MTQNPTPWTRYLVGGAVRDRLLGTPSGDRDWVVVGADPERLIAAGFIPVGRDFPVFLDPMTRDEVALARTERKVAAGYHGFQFQADPSVTLEADLGRRDLTINAMAEGQDGTLIDPYGGEQDLRAGVLRHVSPAFAEDPVRILRLARFAARWPRFQVAAETMRLCRDMVQAGEVDALVPERVWQEWSRGLMEPRPDRMVDMLHACGALARLLPTLAEVWAEAHSAAEVTAALLEGASRGWGVSLRNAVVLQAGHTSAEWPAKERAQALRMPSDCCELLDLTVRERHALGHLAAAGANALGEWLKTLDAWRRPQRAEDLLEVLRILAPSNLRPVGLRLQSALHAGISIDAAAVVRSAQASGLSGPSLGEAVHLARIQAIATVP